MKYWVWGLNRYAYIAMCFLGMNNVCGCVDSFRFGGTNENKLVISLEEYIKKYASSEDHMLVIASEFNENEKIRMISQYGNIRFLVFHAEDAPVYCLRGNNVYPSCEELLETDRLSKAQRVCIYGSDTCNPIIINTLKSIYPQMEVDEVTAGFDMDGWDGIIINVRRDKDDIRHRLHKKKIAAVDFRHAEKLEKAFRHEGLKKYKEIYSGKRIFLIGNGPSLTMSDLDKLHENKEICIGFNKVYRGYDRTKWRADYLCVADHRVILDIEDEIRSVPGNIIYSDSYLSDERVKNIDQSGYVEYIHIGHEEFGRFYPEFSTDITKQVWLGHSVVYELGMQVAAYMGAKEIILLGVDHTINENNVTDVKNHFIDNYYDEEKKILYQANIVEKDKITAAYEYAEHFSRENNFRIYNATRGGKLEVFERVNFDDLF